MGALFRITAAGVLETLYSFCSQPKCIDGYDPSPGLIQATDGNLYGTTATGGVYGSGAIYKSTLSGTMTTLYSLCAQANCPDGQDPGPLIQASDGNSYGATDAGGNPTCGTELPHGVPTPFSCGTIFKMSPSGVVTVLYTFQTATVDGYDWQGALLQASNGIFYGTTAQGGTEDLRTIFSLSVGLSPP